MITPWRKPHTIVLFWWLFWGFISILSLTDLFIPSAKTYLVLIVFIFSFWLGGKLNFISAPSSKSLDPLNSQRMENLFNWLFKVSAWALFLVLLVIVIRCGMLMIKYIDPTIYRNMAFSTPDRVGDAFKNRTLENLYFLISSPILLFLTIEGLLEFWRRTRINKLVIALVINGMDAFFRLGRVNIYMTMLLIFIVFLTSDIKMRLFLKSKVKEIMILSIAVLGILILGTLRGYSAIQQFKLFIIDYHTVGFSLFDLQLTNPKSELNTIMTYGRLTFGGLETMFTIVIRQFDPSYYSPALLNSIQLSKNVLVGLENPPTFIFNGVKYYNSFYTLLYTFYSDGRWVGVFLGGLGLGFFIERFHYLWIKGKNIVDGHILILLISISVMSIFVSQLEIMRTWMMIIFYMIIKIAFKHFHKPQLK